MVVVIRPVRCGSSPYEAAGWRVCVRQQDGAELALFAVVLAILVGRCGAGT